MQFLLVVYDAEIAHYVAKSGVDRLFVDLEQHGKKERQGHLSTWISSQTLDDVYAIRRAAPDSHLLVRVNPLHSSSRAEIDEVIKAGADSIMLPMARNFDEIAQFLDIVSGRVLAIPLIETKAALDATPEIARRLPVKEVYIGLNDLHLDMKMTFMFEPLSNGLLEEPCAALRTHNIKFGIGGLARSNEGIVSPNFLIGEHVRLGSSRAILSRTFHRNAQTLDELTNGMDFPAEIRKLHVIYEEFRHADSTTLKKNQAATYDRIRDVVQLVKNKQT